MSLQITPQNRFQLLTLGQHVYERRCIGCHEVKGDGNGPAAIFFQTKPRDFTSGIFKFRSSPGQDSLPTNADLFKTITHGLWGTAMPPWCTISATKRLAVIQYIKTFSNRWKKEKVGRSIDIPPEPSVTSASIAHGKDLFDQNCSVCHGEAGEGNGAIANFLTDEWEHADKPANFTLPAGAQGGEKLGHDSEHVFQTIMTGVGGTPIPAFQGQLKPGEAWNIVHYEQSLRIKAHENNLLKAGMDKTRLPEARRRLWAGLSPAARQGNIDDRVANGMLSDNLPAVVETAKK